MSSLTVGLDSVRCAETVNVRREEDERNAKLDFQDMHVSSGLRLW